MTDQTVVVEPVVSDAPPVEPVAAPVVATKPEGLADDYWDAERNEVRWAALNEKLNAAAPEPVAAPEGEALPVESIDKIPWTEISVTDGENAYTVDLEDDFVKTMGETFVAEKVPVSAIKALTKEFLTNQVAEAKRVADLLKAETAKLGDTKEKVEERLNAAESFVASVLAKADPAKAETAPQRAKEFRNSWVFASQVEIVEAMMERLNGPTQASGGTPDPNAGQSVGQQFFSGMKKKA
jgi:hypothetical protein